MTIDPLEKVKRRTKVIGRFPGETSCLTLVWVFLDLYITHATPYPESAVASPYLVTKVAVPGVCSD